MGLEATDGYVHFEVGEGQAVEYDFANYTPEDLASVASEIDFGIVVNHLPEVEKNLPEIKTSGPLHRACVESALKDTESTEAQLLHKLNVRTADQYYAYFDQLVSGRGEGVSAQDLQEMAEETEKELKRAKQATDAMVRLEAEQLLEQAKRASVAGLPNQKALERIIYLAKVGNLPKIFMEKAVELAA